MDPVTTLLGVLGTLPQCIQSAQALYELRSRYKDASVLITAIYSESMVIAAALSQVESLLQHDALRSKPQLLETFDRALTGCRVVYGCLEEEVQDLVAKVANDDLRFRDRAKFLWKEDTFKELLIQIRGQQSALSLLIQGLQMESMADIRKLVADNSVTLDQVVKRSKTLRQAHPRVKVPESVFSHENQVEDAADAGSILRSAEFAFDDEIINSKAYRRAMALYTSQKDTKIPQSTTNELEEDDLTAVDSAYQAATDEEDAAFAAETSLSSMGNPSESELIEAEGEERSSSQVAITEDHQDLFDSLEQDILAFMPRNTSASYLTTFQPDTIKSPIMQGDSTLTPAPLRTYSGNYQAAATVEDAPPLPPRRPSGLQLRSASSDDSIHISDAPSVLSKVSTASSYTIYEPSQSSSTLSRKALRKPLPISRTESHNAFNNTQDASSNCASPITLSPLQSPEMHSIWLSLVNAERSFIERMTTFRKTFHDKVIRQWPILERHLGAILIGEQLANLNNEVLLQSMEQQIVDGENATCDPVIFEVYTNKTHRLYREYFQQMPHAASSLRTTQNMDPNFLPFVQTWSVSGYEDYFKLPNVQLQSYVNNLQYLIEIAETLDMPAANEQAARLKCALEAVTWLETLTLTLLEEAQNREDVQNLEKRIHTIDANYLSELRLLEPTRRIRHQGGMAIKLKGQGPWQSVHVLLLDNYLLWGKVKPQKKSKGDRIMVLDAPIAINDLELTLPSDSHQYQRATMFDEIPRGSVVYIITVKNKNSEAKPHMLGTYGYQDRRDWWDYFTASTMHEAIA